MHTRRDVLKRVLVAVPLVIGGSNAVLLAGCGGDSGDTPSPDSIETLTTRQRGTYGPLLFTLDMPKLDYALEETVEWTFRVQNVSRERVELRMITPIIKYWFGYSNTSAHLRVNGDSGPIDREASTVLEPSQILSRTVRLIPSQIPASSRPAVYGIGELRILSWLNVSQINGENVPNGPFGFTSSAEVDYPSIIYLRQDVNVG